MDFVKLLKRLTDLEGLCDVSYTPCKMVSTWDKTGGNADGGDFYRIEGERAIIAELNGPGALVRFYVARATGLVRFYFDGEEKPRVEMDAAELFSGKRQPFPAPLVGMRGRGFYCYVPMPYAKSLRIEGLRKGEESWPIYCQATYLELPAGTRVKTFSPKLSAEEESALREAAAKWSAAGDDPQRPAKEVVLKGSARIAAGGSLELAALEGPAMIHRIRLKLKAKSEYALREALLRAYWDGYVRPSIDCPVGDFFGNGLFMEEYRSLLTGLTEDGFYCFYRMPFARSAELEIMNEGEEDIEECEYEIAYTRLDSLPESGGHFHAKWRREDTAAVDLWGSNLDGHYNYTILDTRGQGRYVGCAMSVVNRYPRWWGEGDPMIFVDDDTWPPSHHGTGTEEFFNDAWGFHHGHCPVAGAMNVGPEETGSGNRCFGPNPIYVENVADSIPFSKRIRVTIEHGTENDFFNEYASTAYWYQKLPARDFFVMRPVEERIQRDVGKWLERYPAARRAFCERLKRQIVHARNQIGRHPTTAKTIQDHLRGMMLWHYNLRIIGAPIMEIRELRNSMVELGKERVEVQVERLPGVYKTLCEFTDKWLRELGEAG